MNPSVDPSVIEDLPKAAPVEFAGQWVAWNREQTEIIGHGSTWMDARQMAIEGGSPDPILQKVPRPESVFIGARR